MFPALSVTLTVLLPLAAALQVNLSPRNVLYKVGDREEIRCSMNECAEEVKFTWGSLADKPLYADYKMSPNESVMVFNSVTKDHENIIKCTAKCKGMSKQATATVRVYSFAKDPVISGHDSLVLGVESTLTCEVTDVYPAEYMEVEWLRGDSVLHKEDGTPDTQTVRSYYTFTPQREDDREQITCRASLLIEDIPPDQSTRETTMSLTILSALQVNLSPRNVLYKVGDREEIRCSMNECPEDVKFTWGSLADKPLYANYKTSPKESVMVFNSVTKDHENIIKCTAKCKGMSKQATATVRVYSFAKDPVISGHDSLVLGVESTLTCEVTDVYPAEYMEVEWLRGDSVLHKEDGTPDTQTVRSYYTFTPQREDDREQITCRASLLIENIPPDQSTRETTISLTILSAPSNVRVSGSTTVLVGSALSLTCEADGSPEPAFSWIVLRPDGQRVRVGETRELSFLNVSLSDAGDYECEASNRIGKKTATVTVIIPGPPTNTVISVSPNEPKEDEAVTISCMSSSVTESRLVLSKLQDGAETELVSDEGPRISIFYSSASANDSGLYICKAFNDYGSQKASVQLLVQAHPLEVTLQPDLSMITVERGSVLSLSCEASGCPHPHFMWKGLEDKPRYRRNDTQTAVSQLKLGPVGPKDDGAFICEVKCGSVVKSKRTEVKIFSFPSHPTIESSGPSLEGEMTNLTCTVRDVFPADRFRAQWLDGETELFSETWSFANGLQTLSSVFSYKTNGGDHDKNISCKVSLEMDGVPAALAEKTASITLAVHYAPRQTTITVSPQKELKEGESISISCLTDSAPEGRVILKKVLDGEETEVTSSEGAQTFFTIQSAELSDSGDYVCEAVNQYGSHRASTQISVQAPPRNTTVKVLPSTSVQEGQNITICCHSVSFPPPAIILRKLDSGIDIYSPNGTFTLINLTPNDTGLYQINVTNALGYETEVFSIHVMERLSSPPPQWNVFITPFIGLGLLTSAAVVLEYLRRARLKGFYELSKCEPATV